MPALVGCPARVCDAHAVLSQSFQACDGKAHYLLTCPSPPPKHLPEGSATHISFTSHPMLLAPFADRSAACSEEGHAFASCTSSCLSVPVALPGSTRIYHLSCPFSPACASLSPAASTIFTLSHSLNRFDQLPSTGPHMRLQAHLLASLFSHNLRAFCSRLPSTRHSVSTCHPTLQPREAPQQAPLPS